MRRRLQRYEIHRQRTLGAVRPLVCAVVLLASAGLSASAAAGADAANAGTCAGHWVQRLGGSHSILQGSMTDEASLRQRLPELEASIRTAVARDPTLGPAVAEALIAAIRSGSGISERPIQRTEAVHWMAYQPNPGEIGVIEPACLRLGKVYYAFEITVEVPDSGPVAQAPTCAIVATRDCAAENPAITVDIRGSSPGAGVTLATNGGAAVAVSGEGELWTVEDPGPFDLDAVFTVTAHGAPGPARATRAYRFLIPKVCGNLAYLGETPGSTMLPASEPAACEKSVTVERCTPAVAQTPIVEPAGTVAERCDDSWVMRPFLFAFFPTGNKAERDIVLPTGPAHESFEVDNGYGFGLSAERRMGPVFGLEGAAMQGRADSTFKLENGDPSGEASHRANFFAFTFGPNFHLLGCTGADLYLGPFVGYGGLADPNYWVGDHHFRATLDGRFLWGAQLGLDLPFRADGPWAFHGGLRYIKLSQDTDAGSIEVDPLLLEVGLAYRF